MHHLYLFPHSPRKENDKLFVAPMGQEAKRAIAHHIKQIPHKIDAIYAAGVLNTDFFEKRLSLPLHHQPLLFISTIKEEPLSDIQRRINFALRLIAQKEKDRNILVLAQQEAIGLFLYGQHHPESPVPSQKKYTKIIEEINPHEIWHVHLNNRFVPDAESAFPFVEQEHPGYRGTERK